MKFMKLGSRPDTFYTTDGVRSVSSEVSSDLIVQVKERKYLLHKFPLLSKCLRLQRLCAETPELSSPQIVQLPGFPGGIEAFELCAKFCYGITITLSAYNIVAVRCAAEYLQMMEDVEKGNLIYKIEVFFTSCILQGWRDSIITLKSTKGFPLWSENLGITSRCIDSIASRVLAHPSKICLSHSYSRRGRDDISCNGSESWRNNMPNAKGWWAKDIAELGIELYWRTMIAIKSGGKVPSNLIGDALRIFASKWLPNISKCRGEIDDESNANHDSKSAEITSKHRLLLESIISLLPSEEGSKVSCGFLSKLLKASNILKASLSSKMEIARRIGIQLEEATIEDLLIPSFSSSNDPIYDVDIVVSILEQFMAKGNSPPTSPPRTKHDFEQRRSRSAENMDFEFQERRRSSSASHSSKLKVAKLVDGYLQEIAHDDKLPLSKFLNIAEAIPDFARLDHDHLYKAIGIYLKEHPNMNKSERKRLCRILDCRKLSMAACMHAAQNELLPLRILVQVLFFEQAKASVAGSQVSDLPNHIKALLGSRDDSSSQTTLFSKSMNTPADDKWSVSGLGSPKSKVPALKMKLAEDEFNDSSPSPNEVEKSSKMKPLCLIPNRPKGLFSKLWSRNSMVEKN
ncbi:hypothetical protein LIER_26177 [Lithospermum erythrorhizon]|uniref:NPH3 domain-containing protein n=1 Tax=Lithospermum erythrorhizon TaxID=34254 RepID=A0AAV3R8Y6_LITER